ncbi:MAG: hypothetical protein IBX52_04135 [Bacterioplanes sp.]|nr:hypothetical protein [Bacterioplanes sp.]
MKHQSGSVLLLTLVMLTGVTMMAMVALQRSSVQIRMVGNSQIKEATFQTALNELDAKYRRLGQEVQGSKMLIDALRSVQLDQDGSPQINPNTGSVVFLPAALTPEQHPVRAYLTVSSQIQYTGNGAQFNHSFADDSSQTLFQQYRFSLLANAEAQHVIASQQTLGVSYLAAKGQ